MEENQGVTSPALIIAVRKGHKGDGLAQVFHGEMWGGRNSKSAALGSYGLKDAAPRNLNPSKPYSMFYDINQKTLDAFSEGFCLSSCFLVQATGIITARDDLAIDFTRANLKAKVGEFLSSAKSDDEIRREFFGSRSSGKYPAGDSRSWKLPEARNALRNAPLDEYYCPIQYRPFDNRQILYHENMVDWPRFETMGSFPKEDNLALLSPRMTADEFSPLVSSFLISNKTGSRYDQSYFFALYSYPNDAADQADALAPTERTLNFDPKLYAKICKAAGIDPADRAGPEDDFRAPTGDARPSEVKVFDYIYGVLHSPDYRETFAEFLKIDFPRIPYPASPEVFKHVSEKGEALRRLHLMEDAAIGEARYPFLTEDGAEPEETNNDVAPAHPKFVPTPDPSRKQEGGEEAKSSPSRVREGSETSRAEGEGSRSGVGDDGAIPAGRVYINKHQYFDGVPQVAWEFYIGGYQPAQKWLKDRKGRALDFNDVGHYQKIVKILIETDRIMREIELPLDLGD